MLVNAVTIGGGRPHRGALPGELARDGRVLLDRPVAAEPAVRQLPEAVLQEEVDEAVRRDQQDRDDREVLGRDVVPEREHVACGRDRPDARALLLDVLVGVVGGAHERPGGDVLEAERVGGVLERGELLRLPVAHDRQVALGRPQVLADREHLHALLAQLPEGFDHLLVRLAEAHHEAGLGRDLAFTHLQRVAQDAQRALPARAAAGDRVEPRRDLDVVVEDVGALGDHLRQRHLLAAEVGRQALDLAPRRLHADRADHADPRLGAVVGQVVAVDARHHRMAQAHLRHRAGDAQRLERVVEGRLAGLDVAEAAAARAGVAEDHEGRRAALPAVADVRAGGLLADRVQALVADHPVELPVALAARRRDLEPARLAAAEGQRLRPEHLEHVHAARVGSRARAHV